MIVRIMMTSIVLLVSLHASSQPSPPLQFDEVFETVLKTGRLDPQQVIKALDRLRVTATRPQDSIPILCVRALSTAPNKLRDAVQLIRNAQALANDLGIKRYDHQMLYLKGYLFKSLNEDSSHRYLTEALQVAKVAGDSVIISESLTILSFLEMERGNFLKAWRNLDQSQRLFSKTDYRRIANNRTNQSHALSAIGLFERSIAVADEGIAVVKQHPYPGSRNDLMSLYGNVINAYVETARPERAMQYAQEAQAMFPNLDSLNAFNSYFMISLGNTYLALDSAERALEVEVFELCTLNSRYKTALFQRRYGIFKANLRLHDLQSSRLAAREIVRNIPAIRGLKNKIDIYQIAEEAFLFLNMRDSAYHYHQMYFENYKQLYNQEQSSAILESEFTAELAREREMAQLHALMLQSEIKLSDQRVLFLMIILALIISLVVLLVVRYRSLRKFSFLLEQKVQERTRELTDRNHQLSEYAFINAHKVRAPLARVLGLSDLIAREKDVSEVIRLSQLVKRESESLDTIIRSINVAIQEDRVVSRHDLQ